LAAARAGFEMGVPFNELNRAFDLGFKPLPWGNQGHIATALQPVGGKAENGKQKAEIRRTEDPFTRLASALTVNGDHR
jgi:hypothetical protein